MPEFLEKRFSSSARMYLSVVSIFAYVITKISVTIFAGAVVFETLLGIDFWTGAIIVVIVTGLYTILGGLKAVIYTDTIQMFLLLGGSILVTIFGLNELKRFFISFVSARSIFENGMFFLVRKSNLANFSLGS